MLLLADASLAQQLLPQVVSQLPPPTTLSSGGGVGGGKSAATIQQKPSGELAPVTGSSREIEKQIVDKILGEGYDKRIRPAGSGPYNASKPGKSN